MLDILMQRKSLGTPFIDNFSLLLEDEFNKINVYENVASTLMKIGGRVGNLMDIAENAMSPDSQMGKEISNQEKDHIFKAINGINGINANINHECIPIPTSIDGIYIETILNMDKAIDQPAPRDVFLSIFGYIFKTIYPRDNPNIV
jgi:hypothetical protein